MILTLTPNPCVDKTIFLPELKVGAFMRSERYTCIPGGKGTNVSRATKALGRATKAMVVVGGHSGAHVVEMIEQQDGVECVPVRVASPTRTITTILEEPIHRQTAFFEPGSTITPDEASLIVDTFRRAVQGVKVVTFNGTVSDPVLNSLYRDLIPIAKEAGALTILDSHGASFSLGLESEPYMIKPNLAETEELIGFHLETPEMRWKAVSLFHARGIELVVLSLGDEGAMVSRGGERFVVTPPLIEEVNAVGSGDSLVAGFAIGLAESMSLADMAALGVAAGTANAMSWDIGHFTMDEVEAVRAQVKIVRV
jgi:1-phosphofructokinase family hexose kinase